MRASHQGRRLSVLVIAVALTVTVLAAFWNAQYGPFITLDDPDYVVNNNHVAAGLTWAGASWAFTSFHAANWHPLTWISHMADAELFGFDPRGHHLVNILLHAANTVLLFAVLLGATRAPWESAFAAALFGVHPLHVESVAWVAERKDVLSTFFLFITMLAYLRYVRRPGSVRYMAVVAGFSLGLLCKPMVVTLPAVLVLLDFWPLGRFRNAGGLGGLRRIFLEKAPLLVLSALTAAITLVAQNQGQMVMSATRYPFPVRVANAFASYTGYIYKTFLPRALAIPYSHAGPADSLWGALGSLLLLAAVTGLALRARERFPWAIVGWSWYLGTLVPVIGLVQVADQSMADRYTYVPLIGLFLVVAWGAGNLALKSPRRWAIVGAFAVAVIVTLVGLTIRQVSYWRSDATLFGHSVEVAPESWMAQYNYGVALDGEGRIDRAIDRYRTALALKPDYAEAHNNLGVALGRLGLLDEAQSHFREALRSYPGMIDAHFNLAKALSLEGRMVDAIDQYREVLRLDPRLANAHHNLGLILFEQAKYAEARRHLEEAERLRHNPDRSAGRPRRAF